MCLVTLTWWNRSSPGFLVPQHLSRAPAPKRVLLRAEGVQRQVPRDKNKVWSWNLFAWCTIVALGSCLGSDLVLWSAIAGLVGLRKWIGGSVVERGSMARFACRGATLAVALAWLFERFLERLILAASPQFFLFLAKTGLWSALGGVEELTKFMSLIWFSWSGAKFWRCKRPLAQQWPKGVMLAGFSVGVGFMVVENCTKFCLAFRLPPMENNDIVFRLFRLIFFRILPTSDFDWHRCGALHQVLQRREVDAGARASQYSSMHSWWTCAQSAGPNSLLDSVHKDLEELGETAGVLRKNGKRRPTAR